MNAAHPMMSEIPIVVVWREVPLSSNQDNIFSERKKYTAAEKMTNAK
jgi:hypothetical protein